MATKKVSRRGALMRWLVLATLILLGAGAATLFLTREPLLMERAAKVTDTEGKGWAWMSHLWVDNQRILFFKHTSDDYLHNPNWQENVSDWDIYECDIVTKQEKRLAVLKEAIYPSGGRYTRHSISPDGRLMLSAHTHGFLCCTLDGKEVGSGDLNRWSKVFWMGDSSHLVEYAVDDNQDKILFGRIHSLRPSRPPRTLQVPVKFKFANQEPSVSTKGQVLATTANANESFNFVTSVDVYETRIGQEMKPPRRYHVHLPVKAKIDEEAFSPDGDRIVWPLWQDAEAQPPVLSWLNRRFPWLKLEPHPKMSIWVSHIDGSAMHEVGCIPLTPDRNGGYIDVNLPTSVQWLPDGKRLSFVYKDALYIVPTD